MIRQLAEHRMAFVLLAALLLVQSFITDLNNPYQKPIAGDAKGYYAYLPALFIYQDLDYGFIPAIEEKYYVPSLAKSFVNEVDGEKVNKTFPGVTVLYLPFFLAAHAWSLALGLPADGYAYTYQLFYLAGFWFYFLLGLIFFRKVLTGLNFSRSVTDLSLLFCVLGTNIFFYTVYDASVTHVYNFFLVNLAIFLSLKLQQEITAGRLVLLLSVLALIGITRPTNFLVFGLIAFFIPDRLVYQRIFRYLMSYKNILKTFIFPALILSIPLILWKLQTGKWIVYSYGEEGFNFLRPELYNFLFSYTKGWFVYTPLALLVLIFGLVLLFRSDKKRGMIALLFYALAIYLFSSWWCWYYGAGMSQRVMIDYTLLLGFLLALILRFLQQHTGVRILTLSVFGLLTALNIAQAFQVGTGILPMGSPTRQQYWDNFLVFEKRARIYPQEHWQLVEAIDISMNPDHPYFVKGFVTYADGTWQTVVSGQYEYSAVFRVPAVEARNGSKLVFAFEAKSTSPLEETRLVVNVPNGPGFVFFLKEYVSPNRWTRLEFMVEPQGEWQGDIELYFWNAGSAEYVDIRELQFLHYFSDDYF